MKKSILLLLVPLFIFSQEQYPKDYYESPLEVPLILSGTFAELRSNHFHSGIDIKTQQREGLNVLACAKGHISRIKIQHFGYGKALYMDHPNGTTTVYAHLQKFSEKIEKYVKKRQYDKELYTIELFPEKGELTFEQGELIGYSGNSGSSGGPHLHFEIRDSSERPMNPLMFGFNVKDTTDPLIRGIYAYVFTDSSHVNQSQKRVKLKLTPTKTGDFIVPEITAYGKIGFGVETVDKLDYAHNKNGVFNITTEFNGIKNYELSFERFSFAETRYLNRFIDYEFFKKDKRRIQKLYKESNNPLSIITFKDNNGFLDIEEGMSGIYTVVVKDYEGNSKEITIPIKGMNQEIIHKKPPCETPYYAYSDQPFSLDEDNISVYIPKNALYDDTYLEVEKNGDTITLHNNKVPLHKNISIRFDTSNYSAEDKKKLFVSSLNYKNNPSYSSTYKKENSIETKTKNFGKYTLTLDTIPPRIKPYNFHNGKWLSKYRYLKVKISDDLSGIKRYRATINGKFILMEYDYKKNVLVYDFEDNIIEDTENNLKVVVTDNVGNSSTFETVFYRKIKPSSIESTN